MRILRFIWSIIFNDCIKYLFNKLKFYIPYIIMYSIFFGIITLFIWLMICLPIWISTATTQDLRLRVGIILLIFGIETFVISFLSYRYSDKDNILEEIKIDLTNIFTKVKTYLMNKWRISNN